MMKLKINPSFTLHPSPFTLHLFTLLKIKNSNSVNEFKIREKSGYKNKNERINLLNKK
jgi:hypothetical protein